MKLFELRMKANKLGFIILEQYERYIITNNGTSKYLKEVICKDLEEVEKELYNLN